MKNIIQYISDIGGAIKTVFVFVLVGVLIGIGGTVGYYHYKDKPVVSDQTTVRPISGTPATVKKTEAKKDSVSIITDYTDSGESEIIIPYTEIPAAHKWINYKYSIHAYYMSDNTFLTGVGYRIDQLTIAGGVFARVNRSPYAGLWMGGSWSFDVNYFK
jgi:hypothetical protein